MTFSVETKPWSRSKTGQSSNHKNSSVEPVPYEGGRKVRDGDSVTHSCIHTYFQGTGLGAGDNSNNNKVISVCARTVPVASLD